MSEITEVLNLRTGNVELRPVPSGSTEVDENEAIRRLYAWKQYWRRGADLPGFSEPVRLGGVWHSGEWAVNGFCGACGGRAAVLTEGSGWSVTACAHKGLHGSLSDQDHRDIADHRKTTAN